MTKQTFLNLVRIQIASDLVVGRADMGYAPYTIEQICSYFEKNKKQINKIVKELEESGENPDEVENDFIVESIGTHLNTMENLLKEPKLDEDEEPDLDYFEEFKENNCNCDKVKSITSSPQKKSASPQKKSLSRKIEFSPSPQKKSPSPQKKSTAMKKQKDDEKFLDIDLIEKGDFNYVKKIFTNYIKFNFGTERPKNGTYYYHREFDSNQNLYEQLGNSNIICVKTDSYDEAKILDVALNILIANYPQYLKYFVEVYQENKEQDNIKITTEKLLFLEDLLPNKNIKADFRKYVDKLANNKNKKATLESVLDSLDDADKLDTKDWLEGQLTEEDFDKYNEAFPEKWADEEEEEERKPLPQTLTTLKVENEEKIPISEFFETMNAELEDSEKLLKPREKSFEYKYSVGKKYETLEIKTYDGMPFDRVDILKLLNTKLDDDLIERIDQIFNV